MRIEKIEAEKERIRQKISKGILIKPEDIRPQSEEDDKDLLEFVKAWYTRIYFFDFLEAQEFEEQIFHSPSRVQIKSNERILFDGGDATEEDFELALEILCLKNRQAWNTSTPFASFDAQLRGRKLRATLIHRSLCKEHGSKLFLRSHSPKSFALESFTEEAPLLRDAVQQRKNILVCGGTGSGKTSLLNALLKESHSREHLLVLEDTHEILSPHENTTRLLARQNQHGDLRDFMAHAMRMSPDRIVVGELRSSEIEPFLLAMNSGHRGLMGTIHANTAVDAVSRAALLMRLYSKNALDYELVCKLVCQSLDLIVYMEGKKVVDIVEVYGSEGGQVFHETLSSKSRLAANH